MENARLVAVTLSVVMVHGGAALAAGQSVPRTLSVEQKTIKDVAPPAPSTPGGTGGLEVVAWVDRPDSTYARGERVRLFVQTNRDAYVTVLNVDPAGETTVLFPNEYQSDNFVQADRAVEVPDPDSRSRVVVSGPVGTELIKVVASTTPIPLFEARQLSEAGAFSTVRANPAGTARSLTVAMTGQSGSPSAPEQGVAPVGTGWAMCHQTIATIPTPSAAAQRTRSLQVVRTRDDRESVRCDEAEVPVADGTAAGGASVQDRVQRSIDGPVTREAVTRSLVVVPENAGEPGGPSEVSLMLRIAFGFDSAELTGGAREDLDRVAAALNDPQLAAVQLTLEGHTDATGAEDYNLRLSRRRADAVVAYLVARGVADDRLRVAGFGEYQLLSDHAPDDERQRRVEIVRSF